MFEIVILSKDYGILCKKLGDSMKKKIQVVAAAIEKDGKFLCAQRPAGKSLAGLWEFPGGKIEKDETAKNALLREIKEELNIDIEIIDFVNIAEYEYDFGIVEMQTYIANIISGNLELLEHDNLLWLPAEKLPELDWAPVDLPAVALISKK